MEKTKFERSMVITAIETKNKWEKMAYKYRTMRNGEKSEKHK